MHEHALDIPARLSIASFADAAFSESPTVLLSEVASIPGHQNEEHWVAIFDTDGRMLSQVRADPGWPSLSVTAPMIVDGRLHGEVAVKASLVAWLAKSGAVALLSVALGAICFHFFRTVPLRAVERTIGELESRNAILRRSQAELQAQHMISDTALSHMLVGLAMFDSEDRLIASNPKFKELYNLPEEAVRVGTPFRRMLELGKSVGNHPGLSVEEVYNHRREQILRREPTSAIHRIGDGRVISVSHAPLDGGGWLATHEDITERCENEARLGYLASHDSLTGLPNRVLLRDYLEGMLDTSATDQGFALHFLDLDGFKEVNDTLGHQIGDGLLKRVSERLRDNLGSANFLARLGGDEFTVIQTGVAKPEDAGELAAEICDLVAEPYSVDGHEIRIGTSIGIVLGPSEGQTPDELLRTADLALYRAKASGRGTSRLFVPEMDAAVKARRILVNDLRLALTDAQFELCFQPLFSLEREAITGFEALLRWQHPVKGMISPADFIPAAEETGLIHQIGAWALREACMIASRWPDDIKVAVNLSPVQFRRAGLPPAVLGALADSGLCPARLELEVTESVLLEESEHTLLTLYNLRELGVRVALDDFGTGFSSLSYLRKFPFDKIKIDRSFVRGLQSGHESAAIVSAITNLGRKLGMVTTAEGVETLQQLEVVRAEGCTEIQGYLISPPRPAVEVDTLLRRFNSKCSASPAKLENVA